MATFDVGLGSQYLLRLVTDEGTVDVPNNQSIVNWSLTIYKLSGSGRYTYSADSWGANIGGAGYGGSFTYDFRSYSSLTIGSGSLWIGHDSDGSKTIYSTGTFNDVQANLGAGTAGGYLGLTTIPRASTPTFALVSAPSTLIGTADSGVAIKINMNRASSGFTHTVKYQMGSTGPTTIASGVATEVSSWTIPLSLMNEIPSTTSGLLSIIVDTYNGATLIGSKTVQITMTVPSSILPDFTTVTAAEATAGVAANVGAFVQGISTLALAITGAVGAYSSTISSYKIELTGTTINAASGTSNLVPVSGAVSITGTITDSRGRVKVKSVNVTVLAYTPPTITSATFQRALVSGTPDDSGTYIRVNLNAAVQSLLVSSVQKNQLVYKIYTRPRGPGAWTLKKTSALSAGTVTFNSYDFVGTYTVASSFDVRVEILDDFNLSAVESTVPTSIIFMHWDAALGVGIGKYRENGALDVAGTIFHNNGLEVLDLGDIASDSEAVAMTATAKLLTPRGLGLAFNATRRTGTVSETWTSGLPTVNIVGVGDVSAYVADPDSIEVQPGSQVIVELVESQWFIISSFATKPKFSRQLSAIPYATNNWGDYEAFPNQYLANTYGRPRFTKTSAGIVIMAGLIKKVSGSVTNGEVILTLPVGFRPDTDMLFPVYTNAGQLSVAISASTGQVTAATGAQSAGFHLSLSNIRYPAAGVATWTNITLTSPWTAHGAVAPAFWRDPTGLMWHRGAVQGGSTGTTAWTAAVGDGYDATRGTEAHIASANSNTAGFAYMNVNAAARTARPRIGIPTSISPLVYPATGNTLAWVPVSGYLNGGTYAGGFPGAGWGVRSDGLVFLQGLMTANSMGSPAFQLPEGLRPKTRMIFVSPSNDTYGRVDITADGLVVPIVGSATWFAIDGIMFAPEQ